MRVSKLVATPVAALTLFVAGAAIAGDLATIQTFDAVNSTPCATVLCIVPSPEAVGRVCNVSANGLPVASVPLMPGPNFVVAPAFGPATSYTASGPGIGPSSCHPDNPGIN